MKTVTGDALDLNKREELFSVSPTASPFITTGWQQSFRNIPGVSTRVFALDETVRYGSLALVMQQENGSLAGRFTRRGIIYGGPLVREGAVQELKELLRNMADYYRGRLIYLECRPYFDYSAFASAFLENGWEYIPWLNIQVPIRAGTMEELLAGFHSTRRRNIRQSLAAGAEYREATSEAEILELYGLLCNHYRRRVRLPLPSREFFLAFLGNETLKAFVVKHGGRIVGGAFCPVLPGKAIYTMYYAGLREPSPGVFPTHLAILAAFEHGMKTGCRSLDFMGAGKPGEEYGVRRYKLGFGGELVEQGRFVKVLAPFTYQAGKLGIRLKKWSGL